MINIKNKNDSGNKQAAYVTPWAVNQQSYAALFNTIWQNGFSVLLRH